MDWNEEPLDDVDPMAARDAAMIRQQAPRLQAAPRRRGMSTQGGPQVFGSIADYGRMAARAGAAEQGAHMGGMINQIHGAVQRENDSRVAQVREMRRMEHEKAMKRMELDAILARIQQARG